MTKQTKTPLVFVKDKAMGWRPARQMKTEGGKAVVTVYNYKDEQSTIVDGGRTATGKEERTISLKDYPSGCLPLANVDGSEGQTDVADMVQLPYLHEVSFRSFRCFRRVWHLVILAMTGLDSADMSLTLRLLFLLLGCYLVQPQEASHVW